MQISIITSLFNRLDLTRACVDSLRHTLRRWDYEWILIDDGSTDGTREFLRALAGEDGRARVTLNDQPRGFAANNNHGARIARAPLLCPAQQWTPCCCRAGWSRWRGWRAGCRRWPAWATRNGSRSAG